MANLGIENVLFPIISLIELHYIVHTLYHLLPDLGSTADGVGVLGSTMTPGGVSVSLAIVPHHPESPEKMRVKHYLRLIPLHPSPLSVERSVSQT